MADSAESLVYAINDLQTSLERITVSQEAFHRDLLSLLKEIAADVTRLTIDTSITDAIGTMAQDISVIADRYRLPDYEDD